MALVSVCLLRLPSSPSGWSSLRTLAGQIIGNHSGSEVKIRSTNRWGLFQVVTRRDSADAVRQAVATNGVDLTRAGVLEIRAA